MNTHLSPGELRAIADLLDKLDVASLVAAGPGDNEYAFTGDVPVLIGDTHLLVGWAENVDGEGHILRLAQEAEQ